MNGQNTPKKTSFIPQKASLEHPRKSLLELKLEHIEGIHIAIFLALVIFLFMGLWKRPNLR